MSSIHNADAKLPNGFPPFTHTEDIFLVSLIHSYPGAIEESKDPSHCRSHSVQEALLFSHTISCVDTRSNRTRNGPFFVRYVTAVHEVESEAVDCGSSAVADSAMAEQSRTSADETP